MKCRILILVLAGWIFFAFARCSSDKAPPRCSKAWRMPDGAICRTRTVYTAITRFSECDPPGNYEGPPRYEETEVCE